MKQFMLFFSSAALALTLGAAPAPTVTLKGDAFVPSTIVVTAGQTVTFDNEDDDAHTVTATDGSFDSKGLDTHQRWTHVFAKPGRYAYFCTLHPFMKGVVVVRGAKS